MGAKDLEEVGGEFGNLRQQDIFHHGQGQKRERERDFAGANRCCKVSVTAPLEQLQCRSRHPLYAGVYLNNPRHCAELVLVLAHSRHTRPSQNHYYTCETYSRPHLDTRDAHSQALS